MVLDALRAYFQLASGVTEESRQRAVAAARSVLAQTPSVDAGSTGQLHQQVAALAEDLMVTSRANRELLLGLIRTDVERRCHGVGIASADEVDALRRSVERLERLFRDSDRRPPLRPLTRHLERRRSARQRPARQRHRRWSVLEGGVEEAGHTKDRGRHHVHATKPVR